MINSLKIQNFRMLEDFEVNNLGRVNLIVGKNNSGKSTVLEALRILAGNAHPSLLEDILIEHDEKISKSLEADGLYEPPFQTFFTGRNFPDEDQTEIHIKVSGPYTKKLIRMSHILMYTEKEEIRDNDGGIISQIKRKIIPKSQTNLIPMGEKLQQGLRITTENPEKFFIIDLNDGRSEGSFRIKAYKQFKETPASLIPTRFISIDDLADIWDEIQFLSNYEDFVKQGLKIISDDFEGLAFVKRSDNSGGRLMRTCIIKLKGIDRGVPLKSMGDGMLRILQLILKTYPAKGGFLLIDEFENGLHFSVQKQVWDLLFKLAEKLDIQVFATTHSWDCIESFAEVAKDRKDNQGVLFRMGRSIRTSDRGKVIATVFDSEKLASLTQADVEVR